MNDKKSFILRINPDTFQALEKWAADEFRSVNGQIEYLLHEAVLRSGRGKTGAQPGEKAKTKGKEKS
ncbi:Arc family DNA binding domain-containing protein [Niabella yanshanensis]|uniref:Arc family DNA binding domain-containing protein n=1 Tax=Niabella yanshanensis TaxID=577386 RepID=A0ABZ0W9P4_9BACT|nr:Arc family DNA binding domain-containing protein [Niabella yanshanensis]WQD39997.1 Arc family DNA binding domain-containing protein [Niabella yanshanensis]